MRCERGDLNLLFIVIGLCLLLVSGNLAYGETKVRMPVRPFAVYPENKLMKFDGIFNTGTDKNVETIEHIIGVILENESEATIANVTATASFEPGSGVEIDPGNDTYEYGDLEPGILKLGFFRARFDKNSPGKPTLAVTLRGDDSFADKVERKLFVISSTLDGEKDNRYTAYVPEGKITVEVSKFYGGKNKKSSTAPKGIKFKVEYPKAFEDKLSPLPYGDPYLTTVAIQIPEDEYLTAIDKETAKSYGTEVGITAKNIGRAVFAAAIVSLISTKGDPFRIGQENTSPGPGEVTVKEEVDVSLKYPKEPLVGKQYSANVQWTYKRTTDARVYTYKFKGKMRNKHFTGKPTKVNIETRDSPGGKEYFITAQTHSPDLINNKAYFVANLFRADDKSLKEVVHAVVLRDDGYQGDVTAGDGTYTGVVSAEQLPPDIHLKVRVFGFDINKASESDSPSEAAKKIGGVLISAPPPILFVVKPGKEKKKESKKKSQRTKPGQETIKPSPSTAAAGAASGVLRRIFSVFSIDSITIDGWGTLELGPTGNSGNFEDIIEATNISGSLSGGVKLSLGHELKVLGTSHNIGVSLGYRAHLSGIFSIEGRPSLELSTYSIPLEFFYRMSLGKKSKSFLGLSTGLDFFKSNIKEGENLAAEAYEDSITGGHVSLEIGHFFEKMALTFNVGYLAAKLKDFKNKEFPDATMEALNLDFSGLKFSFGFKLRLK